MSEKPGPVEAGVAVVLDNRGLLCAQGLLRLMRAMLRLPPGSVVIVLSTDAAAEQDYPAWCRATGHRFLGHRWESDPDRGPHIVSELQKRAGEPSEAGEPR